MTKEQYWYCECLYSVNATGAYAIKNGLGEKIVEDDYASLLEEICQAHNLCILDGELI